MREPYRRRVVAKVPAGIGLVCEQVKILYMRQGMALACFPTGKSVAYSRRGNVCN
jgi:hypothetical protein